MKLVCIAIAGEDLSIGDAVWFSDINGKVYRTTGYEHFTMKENVKANAEVSIELEYNGNLEWMI